ncbi:MAG: M23 family metallopeptidase [Bacteroidales bacterium]|nr:M23 family metallopeptidase [Bacteroidales bacterium]
MLSIDLHSRRMAVSLLLLLSGGVWYAYGKPSATADTLLYPLFIRPQIAGNFAELRRTHYHGGLDFRTHQRCGLRVRSVADGEIYKIGLSAKGYGKVLYVRHNGGEVSVYAHLSRFHPAIERMLRVRALKMPKKRNMPDVILEDWVMPVQSGQVIARSGNTGASGGPHLHFEWRSGEGEDTAVLVNPCLKGWTVTDHTAPLLKTLAVYPMDTESHVAGRRAPLYWPVSDLPDTCRVGGRIGFGLEALDSIEKLKFHYGLYALTFSIDGDTLAHYRWDSLPLRYNGTVHTHIDTAYYRRGGGRVELSRVDGRTPYTPYRQYKDGGCLVVEPHRCYRLVVTAADFNGNVAFIQMVLAGDLFF